MRVPVSTIMPIGGHHTFLVEAVMSALAELPPDGELVLVWDGVRPLDGLPRDDRVIDVILEERRGTPSALNCGFTASRGELILRLDSDDRSSPLRASTLMEFLGAYPGICCVGSFANIIDASGTVIGEYKVPVVDAQIKQQLLRKNAMIHSSAAIRRDAFEAVGGYREECLRMQDYDLFMRLAEVGEIANIPETLIDYRVHGAMSSRSNSPWKGYTRVILRQRHRLARHLGRSRSVQAVHNLAWFLAQVLRYYGVRQPGHSTH